MLATQVGSEEEPNGYTFSELRDVLKPVTAKLRKMYEKQVGQTLPKSWTPSRGKVNNSIEMKPLDE